MEEKLDLIIHLLRVTAIFIVGLLGLIFCALIEVCKRLAVNHGQPSGEASAQAAPTQNAENV